MKRALVLFALVLAAGCNTNVRFDPEGYRCDPGGVCPNGYTCVDDVCRRAGTGPCDGFACDQPPAAECADGQTLRTFAGRCDSSSGQPTCQYEPVDTTCADGCANGACVDPCASVSCVTPPPIACVDANTLRTFAQTGTCAGGTCTYAPTDSNCPNGCVAGECRGADLCAGKTCTTPPMPVCMNTVQRTFDATGTCEPTTGQCQYPATDTPCPNGCVAGLCVAQTATFTQIGPRVRFPITAIDQAPNSGGGSVVAVGAGGRVARWNGTEWTEVANTPSTANLNRVNFVTGSLAYIVGDNKTVWAYQPSSSTPLLASTLPGPNGAKLVGLSGRSASDVFIADDSGSWWHLTSSGWQTGNLSGGDGPYEMTSAYLDESGRERIAGTCGGQSCVAYRFPGGASPNWLVDTRSDSLGFDALGGSFDAPTTLTSDALAGQSDDSLFSHSNIGVFTSVTPSPALSGGGVVGITAQSGSGTRQVYVLTSSSGTSVGHLYRLTRSTTSVTTTTALDTFLGRECLSPTESTGVIVAETNPATGSNNVFRRSIVVDQALDVGEDLAGASLDAAGTLALASIYGDVATLGAGSATFNFQRPADELSINAVESRRGTGVLIAGRLVGGDGAVYRVLPASGFTQLGTTAGTTWNALCRVSDTEGWAVGTNGVIARVTASGVTTVTSPTTKDLLAVDCAPGFAVATGASGTVLVFNGSQWSAAPALTGVTASLTGVGFAASARAVFVAGDGVFAKFEAGAWTTLPARPGLQGLVVRAVNDVYGTVVSGGRTDIVRFDGVQWSASLLRVTGVLGGGVQVGSRVVWGGSGGAVVEGR